jgi:hypothetical protein
MENTRKEDKKRIWRMHQEYFAVNGEYADRHTVQLSSSRRILAKNKKNSDLKSSHQT